MALRAVRSQHFEEFIIYRFPIYTELTDER